MPEGPKDGNTSKFHNPVYANSFPDPFVLKFRGEYYAYCTGITDDGLAFGVLRSRDLVKWQQAGGAMRLLDPSPPYYWAPEVTYANGKFYLYYSTGNETLMELRVGISERPDGGFLDAGRRLTSEEFAIDAHVFIDDDGSRYMFYATDFLEHTHIGTGTVVDRMLDWVTLEGKPRPVTRARYDWQVYDPSRKEKGGVRWHTVEGPAVLKRKGRYFEMFSGGNWQNRSYGVSFATTDDLRRDEEWEQFSDGEKILPILRTMPDVVVGPGHNSVVRGPNNRELYCVYHRWTQAGRVMAIDRMDIAGERIFVGGPTVSPQPAPYEPRKIENRIARTRGRWNRSGDAFVSVRDERCDLSLELSPAGTLFECTFRFVEALPGARAGIVLGSPDARLILSIPNEGSEATIGPEGGLAEVIRLGPDFDRRACHLLRVESLLDRYRIMIDTPDRVAAVEIPGRSEELALYSEGAVVEFAALQLTDGFEELFEASSVPSWLAIDGTAEVGSGRLRIRPSGTGAVAARFRVGYPEFEVAANIAAGGELNGKFGLVLYAEQGGRPIGRFAVCEADSTITFEVGRHTAATPMPSPISPGEMVQLKVTMLNGRATAYVDGIAAAELPGDGDVQEAAVVGSGALEIDMIRVTAV